MFIPVDGTEAEKIKFILERLGVLNEDYTQLSTNFAVLTERVEWLVKFFWLIAGAVVATLITNIIQLMNMRKKK